jgi:hypothetical protein
MISESVNLTTPTPNPDHHSTNKLGEDALRVFGHVGSGDSSNAFSFGAGTGW